MTIRRSHTLDQAARLALTMAMSLAPEPPPDAAPAFETAHFRAILGELLAWRRDVRHFRSEAVSEDLIRHLIHLAASAPSVGFSQPWRFVRVRSAQARGGVRESFQRCNAEALGGYEGSDAQLYAGLKLAGLDDAPEQIAVFCDHATVVGRGLGRRSMPETLDYSVVAAIQTLWLAARTFGLGIGWVSIVDPVEVSQLLRVPEAWKLIAYLCIGYPEQVSATPELQRLGWEEKVSFEHILLDR